VLGWTVEMGRFDGGDAICFFKQTTAYEIVM